MGGHSIGHSKQKCNVSYSKRFPRLFHCTVPKLLIRKRYYMLFLIPVFIVQVIKLVHFRKYHHQRHCTLQPVRKRHVVHMTASWRTSKLLYSETALSRKLFGIGYKYTHAFLLRMTATMSSQNIDLSSWDTLYKNSFIPCVCIYSDLFQNFLWRIPSKS
jgi:hypothetical protein